MRQKELFIVTAVVEIATGLALLALPAFVLASLLGIQSATVEALVIGRLTGAALLAIGVASALARDDARSPAQRGLLFGFLTYNVLAAVLFVYAGLGEQLVGSALWPAVALHTLLAVWCVLCLRSGASSWVACL